MARNYYSLVAGLREFAIDSDRKGFDACAIINEIRAALTDADRDYLRLFYFFYDIENIINMRAGRSQFNELGNFSREELEQEIKTPTALPSYIADVIAAYNDPDNTEYDQIDRDKSFEKNIFEAYYAACAASDNRFIREWYEFDRNLRNVIAAYAARKASLTVSEQLVGTGYVADTLSRSSAADFGLKGELDYIDEVIGAVAEEENLLEKERRLDLIRWRVSDELTPFDYFDMNAIFAYLVKINIIHRWVTLDEGYGREMFAKLMAALDGKDLVSKADNQ